MFLLSEIYLPLLSESIILSPQLPGGMTKLHAKPTQSQLEFTILLLFFTRLTQLECISLSKNNLIATKKTAKPPPICVPNTKVLRPLHCYKKVNQ